jgi:hypothetical protein
LIFPSLIDELAYNPYYETESISMTTTGDVMQAMLQELGYTVVIKPGDLNISW